MQGANRELHVLVFNHDRNLDFRGTDHEDIDPLGRERFKDLAGNAGVRAHTDSLKVVQDVFYSESYNYRKSNPSRENFGIWLCRCYLND